ncbi:hypothetical protein A2442_01095 [Candidatus Campbellbacteria bacterium RIFOXYC2_FULL_35_25]|uniref:Mechanosensitive ion channel protein MscS n=1 Tax=Candidatus Campbellbacteria bacterium RIFOXYC2_FULL_35_25 TaxID=1797582 RepID=A0A1F5EIZ3_9BACT|nr:MAG: hypothetical protein A2442_01095 [Candidatus Campbellbacteria bacterium RIFOXYC2_FULL_35_25]
MNSETIILGNTLLDYSYALGIFLVLFFAFRIFQFFILRRLEKLAKKTKTDIDDTLIGIIKSLKPSFYYFLAFYLATYSIVVSDLFKKISEGILLFLIVYQVILVVQIFIDYVLEKSLKNKDGDSDSRTAINSISKIAKFILWVLGLLLILSNLGVNITSLVAGLGVGGIAIAFALQNILADLFSSFAIYFDKPFKVGDFIVIGTDKGVVEKIGIKTSRLKTLQGEELVISNQELTSARIQNFKKMQERRCSFTFGVTYETPSDKLRAIPSYITAIVGSLEGVRFDRAHFNKFDDSALTYEVIYFVDSGDYTLYMDVQQEINFEIVEKFEKEGIDMAYPTRTVYMKNVS